MYNLCVFCTFSTFAQKLFKGWGCNFTWSFGKVICIKALKMVSVARIIRHKLCMIYVFFVVVQKLFLTKNYFLTAERHLTTGGRLYTCLVWDYFWPPLPILSISFFMWTKHVLFRYHLSEISHIKIMKST